MNIKGLYIDRKMIGILSIFIILGFTLIGALIVASNTLSGLRAFSSLQTFWTEARKDATYELVRYVDTNQPVHLDHFERDLEPINQATIVYDELVSSDPDLPLIKENLLLLQSQPRDINNMIKIFERFHSIEHLSNAVDLWRDANAEIAQLKSIAFELQIIVEEGGLNESGKSEYLDRILASDEILRVQKEEIASNLSKGTQLVTNIIFVLSLSFGGIFLISGIFFSYRFIGSIKTWAGMMDISEQRYKSLFEQNPNIVFSLNAEGFLKSGNEAFFNLTNFSAKNFESNHIKDFPITGYTRDFKSKFNEALNGKADNLELTWQKSSDEKVKLQATILPIRVDGVTEGVFVIAEDITYKIYAEEKIKSQLQEKLSLLGEVHDRVKNNLALISSLLHLQEQYLDDETAIKYIESTISRIKSLAIIHERLYQAENFSNVRMDEFVTELVASIKKNHQREGLHVKTIVSASPVNLDIRQAVPCGLLLNELVINAFKFAFKGRKSGTLWVEISAQGNFFKVHVKDDGVGLPAGFNLEDQSTLGMTMIRILSQQLDGKPLLKGSRGLDFQLSFDSKLQVLKSA